MKCTYFLVILIISVKTVLAQGANTYSFPAYPVDLDFPADYEAKPAGSHDLAIIVSDAQTEFYIKGMNVGPRFDADSLKKMFLNIYDSPEIRNMNVSQIGSGTMGKHPAEKLVLTFMAEDYLYVSTIYLVHFHVNQKYNSILFYFEIGESNVASYAMLQEAMIQSLRYREFNYKTVKPEGTGFSIPMPDFWSGGKIDSAEGGVYRIYDGRMKFTLNVTPAIDSITTQMLATAEKNNFKNVKDQYPDGKIKYAEEKMNDEKIPHIIIQYMEDVSGLKRKSIISKYMFRKKIKGAPMNYTLTFQYPEAYESYYLPIIFKMLNSAQFENSGGAGAGTGQ